MLGVKIKIGIRYPSTPFVLNITSALHFFSWNERQNKTEKSMWSLIWIRPVFCVQSSLSPILVLHDGGLFQLKWKTKQNRKINVEPDLDQHCFLCSVFSFTNLGSAWWGFVSVEMKDKTKQKNQCGAWSGFPLFFVFSLLLPQLTGG